MNWPIMLVTLRGALGRRRTILIALLALVPILIAGIIRVGGTTSDAASLTAGLLDALLVTTVLPLVALVFGTGVLGSELDDGTAVYLLVKPIERWRIVLSKAVVAAAVTILLVVPSTLLSGLVVGSGRGAESITFAFTIAVIPGAVLYATAFVALSVVTGRALIAGLLYVFIWEGLLAGLFAGTALLSVRQYVLAFARSLAGADRAAITSSVDAQTAAILTVVVLAAAIAIAIRRLAAWEVRTAE
ncbi:MAG TPA: ABC transporter permease [Candidatus Limnocylindrales bacterium]